MSSNEPIVHNNDNSLLTNESISSSSLIPSPSISTLEPTLEITMTFRAEPKKRSIKFEDPLKTYHMMLVWDKQKPENHQTEYTNIMNDLEKLFSENNNTLYFTPLIACTNSTYGQVDDYLTNYILNIRKEKNWIHCEKDLPFRVEGQTGDYNLFAHISRRTISEENPLKNSLTNVKNQLIKINIEKYKK